MKRNKGLIVDQTQRLGTESENSVYTVRRRKKHCSIAKSTTTSGKFILHFSLVSTISDLNPPEKKMEMETDTLPNGNSPPSSTTVTSTAASGTSDASAAVSTPAPSSKLSQLAESLKLEHQFLRVPFEHFKKTIRGNHRIVEKEVSAVISGVTAAADSSDLSHHDAVQQLSSLVSRLQGLKRKVSGLLCFV